MPITAPEIAHQYLTELSDGLDTTNLSQVQDALANIMQLLSEQNDLGTFFRRELYRYLSQSPLFERIINGM